MAPAGGVVVVGCVLAHETHLVVTTHRTLHVTVTTTPSLAPGVVHMWYAGCLCAHAPACSCTCPNNPPQIQAACTLLDAPVYFNTLVPHMLPHQRLLKYGVTSLEALQHDLYTWQHMYVAGRMHKPVRWLVGEACIHDAQHANLRAACATSLLLLLQHNNLGSGGGGGGYANASRCRITHHALLATLVGLSYAGDVRMGIAEDANKVQRIVQGSGDGLTTMYQPVIGT